MLSGTLRELSAEFAGGALKSMGMFEVFEGGRQKRVRQDGDEVLCAERAAVTARERHTLTTPVGSHTRSFCTLPRLPDRHNIYRSGLTRASGKRQQGAAQPLAGKS